MLLGIFSNVFFMVWILYTFYFYMDLDGILLYIVLICICFFLSILFWSVWNYFLFQLPSKNIRKDNKCFKYGILCNEQKMKRKKLNIYLIK